MASSIRRFLCVLAFAGLFLTGLSGCGSPDPDPEPPVEAPALSDSEKALALHKAVRAGDMDALRCAIKGQKTPVDVGDRYGTTALMMASDYGHEELVRYLLAAGADVNHRESFFNTSALDLALWRERNEVALVLIGAGADQREEAMEIAIREELPELAQAVVDAGPLNASTVEELLADDDLPQEFREVLEQAETRPDPDPPHYTREQLERFTGLFETWDAEAGADVEVRVTATDAGLRVVVNADPAVDLVASGERRFRSEDGAVEASFWGRLGSIETITLRRGDAPPIRLRQSIGETLGAEGFRRGRHRHSLAGRDPGSRQLQSHHLG